MKEIEIRREWHEKITADEMHEKNTADWWLALRAKELGEIRDIIEEGKKNLVVKTDGHCNPRCHDQGRESAIDNLLSLLDELIEKP
jgi:NTP pyrophosphatase (non-canonical NTP hydrolase)